MAANETTSSQNALLFGDQLFGNQPYQETAMFNDYSSAWFQQNGQTQNPLIAASMPLLGLALRVKQLKECPNIAAVYEQTVDEINIIEEALTNQSIAPAIVIAYRYILCAFLDEAVMGTAWGASTIWAEHSMLSRFHQETWGGEKVFTILQRLETEPTKYEDLLEFIYHCLLLGFKGKYHVMHAGMAERENVILHLHRLLYQEQEPTTFLTEATHHVVNTQGQRLNSLPIWSIFAIFVLALIVIFCGYSALLHDKTSDVLEQLNQIL